MTWRSCRNACLFIIAAISLPGMMTTSGCPNTNQPAQTDVAGIYVANSGNNSILVYPLGSSGDAAPSRVISGSATGMNLPLGIARDTQSRIFVANRSGGTVTGYPIGGDGNIAPIITLTNPDMGAPQAIVVASGDGLFVSNCPACGSGMGQVAIFHFNTNATTSDYRIGGATNTNTGLTVPDGLALDKSNPAVGETLYVGNAYGGNVSVFAPGVQGDQFPLRSFLTGGNLQGFDFANNAVFLAIPGAGITQFPATATGNTPASATLAPSGLVYPSGIFVDSSVTPPVIYLGDYSGNAVFVIQTAGIAPFLTIDSVTTIKGPSTGLSGPAGILVVKG